ncbi:MAG: rRNA maturation RNase YbeY [Eubacteriales bacterium]
MSDELKRDSQEESDIYVVCDIEMDGVDALILRVKEIIEVVLFEEGILFPCEMNVLLTDDEGMRECNLEMRGIDKATDVLSFPMFDLVAGEPPHDIIELDPETGLCPLGDMAISLPRATAQAEEYGHSFVHEVSYLTVHSVLHILGYDHLDEGVQKEQMRKREKEMMKLSIFQEGRHE